MGKLNFIYSGEPCRIVDLRPKQQAVQVQVYCKDHPTESVAAFLSLQPDAPTDIEMLRAALPEEFLQDVVAKALKRFSTRHLDIVTER